MQLFRFLSVIAAISSASAYQIRAYSDTSCDTLVWEANYEELDRCVTFKVGSSVRALRLPTTGYEVEAFHLTKCDTSLLYGHTTTEAPTGSHSTKDPDEESHGMMIYLNVDARESTLLAAYYYPQQMKAVSQGNLQLLDDDGRALVGWGHNAAFTEFSSDGQVLCNWIGRPQTAPDAEVIGNRIYVSWNGATEVVAWQLETWLSGELEDAAFKVVAQYDKAGFETEIEIPENLDSPLFRLAALDSHGDVLDVTELLQRERGSAMERLLNMHYWILGIAFVMSGVGLFLGFCRCCGLDPRLSRLSRWRYRSSQYQMVAFSDTESDRQSV
ncbi:hypothetical protein BP00DRAFT_452509 [Aspergillus indologenus CBS 114.80]|uniref:Uncharacterized protein n=1 Tax=Aspergillus indologenus CBS 114.80 TaxID=1450541 RepID=A0A2V5HQV7_9EURO|nr:hypothetical protein BP00DRAFT_452509 [Aspergillus indologenus CBS 114.80]